MIRVARAREISRFILIFVSINFGMMPIVFLAMYKEQLAIKFDVGLYYLTILYGLYFIIAGVVTRVFKNFFSSLSIANILITSAVGTLGGGMLSFLADNIWIFMVSYCLLFAAMGGAPLLGPLANRILKEAGGLPALSVGLATAGQQTAFISWRLVVDELAPGMLVDQIYLYCSILSFVLIMATAWALSTNIVNKAAPIKMNLEGKLGSLSVPDSVIVQNRLYEKMIYLSYFSVCMSGTMFILNINAIQNSRSIIAVFVLMSVVGRICVTYAHDKTKSDYFLFLSSIVLSAGLMISIEEIHLFGVVAVGVGYGAMLPLIMVHVSNIFYPRSQTVNYNLFLFGSCGIAIGSSLAGMNDIIPLICKIAYFCGNFFISIFVIYRIYKRFIRTDPRE